MMQVMQTKYHNQQSGFSLVELSFVLLIIGIVVGSSIIVGNQQIKQRNIASSYGELKHINKRLKLFAQRYGRLPCPARINLATSDSEYGREATDCADDSPPSGLTRVEYPASSGQYIRIGGVPFKTLNLTDEFASDSWGNRYIYAVAENAISAIDSSVEGVITIQDGSGNTITDKAIYVIASLGETGKGATGHESLTIDDACDSTNLDKENCDDDGVFIDDRVNNGDVAANFFDDYIIWQNRANILEQKPQSTRYYYVASSSSASSSGSSTTSSSSSTSSSSTSSTSSTSSGSSTSSTSSTSSGSSTTSSSSSTSSSSTSSTSSGGSSSGGGECTSSCPNIGDVCSDGTVYTGNTPDGNVCMYTTPSDMPAAVWSSDNRTFNGANDSVSGSANTATIASNSTLGEAADICATYNYLGKVNWYLPSGKELLRLYINRIAIGGFIRSKYWSSTEQAADEVCGINFGTGTTECNLPKNSEGARPYRCVTKD